MFIKALQKYFGSFFLAILLCKMIISVVPIIADHFDHRAISALILQLEIESDIESDTSKQSEIAKDLLAKGCWHEVTFFSFSQPMQNLASVRFITGDDDHVQTFYPKVPTPPPSV